MNKSRSHFDPALLHIPAAFGAALGSGFLLSAGTVSGAASPLAAALAGTMPPLYATSVLLGALLCYAVKGAPSGMHFLLAILVTVTCTRILFREQCKPHIQALMTTLCGIFGGVVLDIVIHAGGGELPLYSFAAVLTGMEYLPIFLPMQEIHCMNTGALYFMRERPSRFHSAICSALQRSADWTRRFSTSGGLLV